MRLRLHTEHELNTVFLSGIFIDALEGGSIDYWCCQVQDVPRDQDSNILSARIFAEDYGDKYGYNVTHEKLVAAIKKILEENCARSDIVESIRKDVVAGGDGDGNMDGECADIIIQIACFGEIVFG